MNANAQRWVEALFSGEYEQTNGKLTRSRELSSFGARYPAGHCCLGVACRLAVEAGVPIAVSEDDNGSVSYDGQTNYLPPSVQDWLGLTEQAGCMGVFNPNPLASKRDPRSLAELNDSGADFNEVGNAILTHKEALFG